MLLALNQFVFILKFFYTIDDLLQTIAMILFVTGQFLLAKYMISIEKKEEEFERYKI